MSKTILVIEDEDSIRKVIKAFLEDAGYTVFEAGDGQEGLEKFRQLHGDEYGQCARNDRRRNFRTACNLNFNARLFPYGHFRILLCVSPAESFRARSGRLFESIPHTARKTKR